MSTFDIAIIGGGIVGLALARSLKDVNLSLILIDADEKPVAHQARSREKSRRRPKYDARVSALTVSSKMLFEETGLWQMLPQDEICPFMDMQVWDADGTGAIHFSAADIHHEALGYIAENSLITGTLDQLVSEQDRLQLLRSAPVTGLSIAAGGYGQCSEISLDSQPGISARLVIGADGARSLVREAAAFRVRQWDYGHRAIVATVKTERSHGYTAWQRFMPSGPLAFLPLPDAASDRENQHYCSIVWSCKPELARELMALEDEAFRLRLAQAFENRLGAILDIDRRFDFPLQQMHALDYVADGIALVGDAAHTIHPLAGQGVNLGLQDVAALATVIREACLRDEDFASERVLSRYQRQRKGANLGMMLAMEGFKRLFESDELLLRWLRNTGLSTVDQLPLIKRQLMSQAMGI